MLILSLYFHIGWSQEAIAQPTPQHPWVGLPATPVVASHADYLVIYITDLGPLGTLGNPSILISLLHLHPPSVLLVKNNLQSSREGAMLSSVWAFVCSSSSSGDAFPHFLLLADS